VLMVGARWIFNSKSYDFWLNTMVRKFLLCWQDLSDEGVAGVDMEKGICVNLAGYDDLIG